MKKSMILLALIFSLTFATALEIQSPETFSQGETLLATIEGNILSPIQDEDVGFYEEHVQIPLTKGIIRVENKYYIYATLPYQSKNLSLKIKDVYFKENNLIQIEDIEKQFKVTDSTADFYANPGALMTQEDFEIELYNNKNSNLEIAYTFENLSDSITLPPQQTTELKISIENVDKTKTTFLSLSSSETNYELPIYVLTDEKPVPSLTEINETPTEKSNITFSIDEIDEKLNRGEAYFYPFQITNIGDEETGTVFLFISSDLEDFVTISQIEIENIEAKQIIDLSALLNFSSIGIFKGELLAESEQGEVIINLTFEVGENVEETSIPTNKKSCLELGGVSCIDSEICSSLPLSSADGLCCTGNCTGTKIDEPVDRNWTAIYIIVGVLAVILAAVWWKMKKPKPINPVKKRAKLS